MDDALEGRIRERAYEIWSMAGRPDGQAEQHWLLAEREVLAVMMAEPSALTPAARAETRATRNELQAEKAAVASSERRLLTRGASGQVSSREKRLGRAVVIGGLGRCLVDMFRPAEAVPDDLTRLSELAEDRRATANQPFRKRRKATRSRR